MNQDGIEEGFIQDNLNNSSNLGNLGTVKKKRGRKPSGKIIDLNKVNLGNDFTDCIIAHLPLSQKDINKISGDANETINKTPQHVFEKTASLSICINDDTSSTCNRCIELENKLLAYKLSAQKNIEINNDETFVQCMRGKTIYKCEPKENETVCWWCCHQFDTLPIGLPERYNEGKFQLHGNFCSFNCAHAYNIQQNDFKTWERYSLLNLYRKLVLGSSQNSRIMSAPPRQILQMFGGKMSIEEFRENNSNIAKEYRYILPPFIPVNGVIEEINKTVNKLPSSSTNLKLKRNKPLPGMNNNLLQLMKKT